MTRAASLIRLCSVVSSLQGCSSAGNDPPSAGTTPTTLSWSGYTWEVRACAACAPGPNAFDDSSTTVWVDGKGSLNLRVHEIDGAWRSAEVSLPMGLGHGKYEWFVETPTDTIDPNVVHAFFLYQSDTQELDIEWSRWGHRTNPNDFDFAIQPSPIRFWHQSIASGEAQIDRIIWTAGPNGQADRVEFQIETDGVVVQDWIRPLSAPLDTAGALVHINNWLLRGRAPSDGASEVLTLTRFAFTAI